MKSTQHLRRCPFCGGKAGLYEDCNFTWIIQCNSCGASTPRRRNYKRVILDWNRRR